MTDEEILKTPIKDLSREQIAAGFAAMDRKWESNRKENDSYEMPRYGIINVISDNLGQGVLNPATGKMHDSKSAYYKDVRAAGCEIMGGDAKVKERTEIQGDYDCREALSKAIDQTGFMDKLKKEKIF